MKKLLVLLLLIPLYSLSMENDEKKKFADEKTLMTMIEKKSNEMPSNDPLHDHDIKEFITNIIHEVASTQKSYEEFKMVYKKELVHCVARAVEHKKFEDMNDYNRLETQEEKNQFIEEKIKVLNIDYFVKDVFDGLVKMSDEQEICDNKESLEIHDTHDEKSPVRKIKKKKVRKH